MAEAIKKKTAVSRQTAKKKYTEGIGRRKRSVARVRIVSGKGNITVGERPLAARFPLLRWQRTVIAPLEELRLAKKFDVSVNVSGGGVSSQAEAVRLGLARALVAHNETFKKPLRKLGFLTRDPRVVERKKYGLKKARRAPQWSKR